MVLSGRGDQSFSIQVQWLQHPQEEIHHLYAFILTNALQPNVQWACNSILENYFSNQAEGGVNEWMTKKKIHIAIYYILHCHFACIEATLLSPMYNRTL